MQTRKFSSIISDMRRLLKEFVKGVLLNEAENDSKYLEKINFRKLHQQTPDADPKELQKSARRGPTFSAITINFIHQLSAVSLPHHNRKEFVKWLANLLEKGEDNWSQQNRAFYPIDVQYVSDWINGANIQIGDLPDTFWEADSLATTWHQSLQDKDFDKAIEKTGDEKVAYEFSDGFKILKLSPRECKSEGFAMGHCVGSYAENIRTGEMSIFSLRDPENKPRVTMNVINSGNQLDQIKGPKNAVPLPDDAKKIKEWLKTAGLDVSESNDYFNILSIEEKRQLFMEPHDNPSKLKLAGLIMDRDFAGNDELTFKFNMGVAQGVVFKAPMHEKIKVKLDIARSLFKDGLYIQLRTVRDDMRAIQKAIMPLGQAAAAINVAIGATFEYYRSSTMLCSALKTGVDVKMIIGSIEKEVGMPLEDFLFGEGRTVVNY